MLTALMNFLTSESFGIFATLFGLLGDAAVLVLTLYTLHITAFSKKLELVSPSFGFSMFEGERMSLTFMNKSLHAIPIQKVFILKKGDDGEFQYLSFAEYENPIVVESWSMKRANMEPFTKICNWNVSGDEKLDPHDFIQNAVIGVKAGKDLIWVKPYKKAPLREAKRKYKKHDYQMLTVERKNIDGKNCSEAVDCLIYVRLKDMNGQYTLLRNFGITGFDGGKSVCLSDSILGYNALPCPGRDAEEIVTTIHEVLGIDKEDIQVQMFGEEKEH